MRHSRPTATLAFEPGIPAKFQQARPEPNSNLEQQQQQDGLHTSRHQITTTTTILTLRAYVSKPCSRPGRFARAHCRGTCPSCNSVMPSLSSARGQHADNFTPQPPTSQHHLVSRSLPANFKPRISTRIASRASFATIRLVDRSCSCLTSGCTRATMTSTVLPRTPSLSTTRRSSIRRALLPGVGPPCTPTH